MNQLQQLSQTTLVIAAGSVDAVLTVAALNRLVGHVVPTIWTQAFQVNQIKVDQITPGQQILFVDLAVNNQDEAMTAKFISDLRASGHSIIGICDEHDAEAWLRVLGNFDGLVIAPQSRSDKKHTSSGRMLALAFGEQMDDHGRELCEAADRADAFKFDTHFGGMTNNAVKSNIADNNRRTKLAEYLAFNRDADGQIATWIAEYEEILRNHQQLITQKEEPATGAVLIRNPQSVKVDMTSLMAELYKQGYSLVVADDQVFDKSANEGNGGKVAVVSFGTPRKDVNLIETLKAASVPATGGFAQKVSVKPEFQADAMQAIYNALFG